MATSDYEQRRKQLERRKAMTEALMTRGMQGVPKGQMVGPYYLPPSIGEAALPGIQILLAGLANRKVDKESAALDTERQQGLAQAFEAMMQSRQQGGNEWQQGALTSPYEEVRQLGMKGFEAELKPETFKRDMVRNERGELVSILSGNRGTERESQYRPATPMKSSYGIAFDPYQVQPGQRIATPPSQSTSVNINMPDQVDENAYRKKLAQSVAEQSAAVVESLQENTIMDNYLNEMDTLAAQGAVTGGLAPALGDIANALSTFGIEVSPELMLTRAGTTLNKSILKEALTGPGASRLTDKDLKVIADATNLMAQGNYQQASSMLRRWNESQRQSKIERLRRTDDYFTDSRPIESLAPVTNSPVPGVPGVPVTIESDADYDALPSGAEFIAPDGSRRRKP